MLKLAADQLHFGSLQNVRESFVCKPDVATKTVLKRFHCAAPWMIAIFQLAVNKNNSAHHKLLTMHELKQL